MNIDVAASVEFTIECDSCGEYLDANWNERYGTLTVEPCDSCMDQKGKEEWRDGHEQGYKEGKQDGLDQSGRCSCTR